MRINCTTFAVPSKLRFENKNLKLINSSKLEFISLRFLFIRDPGGIQTPNRWSRNPVLYSVELQSQFI